MKTLTKHRKLQLLYIFVDILSSLLVWVAFLGFRWMVYEGKVFSVDTILIPMFDFYRPLVLYPLGCIIIYYLSGYYLRPQRKDYGKELRTTITSSLIDGISIDLINALLSKYHNGIVFCAHTNLPCDGSFKISL